MDEIQKMLADLKESGLSVKEALAKAEAAVRVLKVMERMEKAAAPPKPRGPRKKKDAA